MSPRPAANRNVWAAPLAVWAGLAAALSLNVALAFAPLGPAKTAVNLGIAGAMAAVLALVFMQLARASNLVRMAAAAGVLWASFLFLLAGADILARS